MYMIVLEMLLMINAFLFNFWFCAIFCGYLSCVVVIIIIIVVIAAYLGQDLFCLFIYNEATLVEYRINK